MGHVDVFGAVIAPEKVRDYLLSSEHPVGRFKAAFFRALGYERHQWWRLADDLVKHAASEPMTEGGASPYGTKYEVHGMLRGPNGREARVVAVWMRRQGARALHFVTAFPGEKP